MAAVESNHRAGHVGRRLPDVGTSVKDLVAWLTTNPDFAVVGPPSPAELIPGYPGTRLTIGVSETADFAWDDCPSNPRCAAFFTDPAHWGSNFWAIEGDNVQDLYLADVDSGGEEHVFFVLLYAVDAASLDAFRPRAEELVRTVLLPEA
ncbi:hypothetical protein [Propionicimonas sp.]|uniref:hypothetical protein n=1 Tax=Propionicimonas sp. TaxID=1955623 RepID=UPI0039E28E1B